MKLSMTRSGASGAGCSIGCLSAWAGIVAILYVMRRAHGDHGLHVVLESVAALGWIGAVLGGWDASNIEGVHSYHCGGCGASVATAGRCPKCGARLVLSPEVRAREEMKLVVAGGLALSVLFGLVAFLVARLGHVTRGGTPLRLGANVAGVVAFLVMVVYSLKRMAR